jgi:hypothetical protein
MSRLDGRYLTVETDPRGRPTQFTPHGDRAVPVTGWSKHWREWIGVLDGQPERAIWQVVTEQGACELHHLRQPTDEDEEPAGGEWVLFRWED